MNQLSDRINSLSTSQTLAMAAKARELRAEGKDVIGLSLGEPDFNVPDFVKEAGKQAIDDNYSKYMPVPGYLDLRESIAAKFKRDNGLDYSADQIVVSTGAKQCIINTILCLVNPGDEVIIPEPFYANYNGFATTTNINVKPVTAVIDNGFALPPIADFEAKITENTKAILICNPGNPTGYLYTKDEIQKLADLVIKHDLFLIADEVYREFVYDGITHHSILQEPKLKDYAIVIDSVSKRYSMCGARIGYLVSKNTTVISTALKFAQARLSAPTLAQIASEAALNTPDSYFEDVNKEYVHRRDILIQALEKIDGVKVAKPNGAFYCIAELPVKNSDDFARWLLEHFHYENQTVMVAPAAGFYSTPGVGLNQIRIAYVLKEDSLLMAVKILEEALKVYQD